MFDNPEKLFIILLIALFIFGPQKLIGLGSSMGKAIREFRSHVRDAQDQFHAAVAEAQQEVQQTHDAFTASEPAALPAPDPLVPALPATPDLIHTAEAVTPGPDPDAGLPAAAAAPQSGSASPAAESAEDEGPHSLASEPSSHAVWEILQRKT